MRFSKASAVLAVVIALPAVGVSAASGLPAPAFCHGLPVTHSGTGAGDTLLGSPGPDVIHGGGGDDTIYGRGGADVICGGRGQDTLIGGDGPDALYGDEGNDTLRGGRGSDRLVGGGGIDAGAGGPRSDRCTYVESRVSCERPEPASWKLRRDGLGPVMFGEAEAGVRTAFEAALGKPFWESGSGWQPCLQYRVWWRSFGSSIEAQFLGEAFVGYGVGPGPNGQDGLSLATPEGVRIGSKGAEVLQAYPGANLVHDSELGWKYTWQSYEFWLDNAIAVLNPAAAPVRWITVGSFCIPI